jgi:hypothetical protein
MTLRSLEKFVQEQDEEEQGQGGQENEKLKELIQKSRGLEFYKWTDYSPSHTSILYYYQIIRQNNI